MFTCKSSKSHGLWFVIGRFRSVLFLWCFKVRCFVIILFRAIIDLLSLLRRFFWSFLFLSLARIKQRLPPSFDKKSTHHRDFLRYSWAVQSHSQPSWASITMWFAITPPSLKWLTEQKNPKSLLSLHYAQRDTMNFAVIVHNCINKVSEAKQTNKQKNKNTSIYKDTHLGSVNILFCIVWYSKQGYLYITFYEFAVY